MTKKRRVGCRDSYRSEEQPSGGLNEEEGIVNGVSFSLPAQPCESAPTSAAETLKDLGISKSSTLGGITFVPDYDSISQRQCRDGGFNRYCWFAAVDEKGSTPLILKKLLYVLHHLQKYYLSVQKPMGKTAPFEPQNCKVKDAHVTYRGGMSFHCMTEDDSIVSVPCFKISMFIDTASTGGYSAMLQAYQFVVLETPITFDLVECIYRSCSHQSSADSGKILDTMRGFWVDIANHMASTDGSNNRVCAQTFMSVDFDMLFNDISHLCVWRLFRIARCIAAARRHMHLIATLYRVQNCGESWKAASSKIEVRFENIDAHMDGRYNPYEYDAFWCKISDRSASVWYESLDQYKALVEKHKKRKRPRGGNSDANADDGGAEAEEDVPPDAWEPPLKFDVPTFIDFNDQTTRNALLEFLNDDMIDLQRFGDFLLSTPVDSFSMAGFPKSMMCGSVELSLFKPYSNRFSTWEAWSAANTCSLPSEIIIRLLLLKEGNRERLSGSSDDSGGIGVSSFGNELPKGCNTLEEYRQLLKNERANNMTTPLKGRCLKIYLMTWDAVCKISSPVARIKYVYEDYLRNTVLPLVEVNVKSDETGEFGGTDPRLSICAELAAMTSSVPNNSFRCRAVYKFREGLKSMCVNTPFAIDIIKRFRGTLASAEGCMYLMHELRNLTGNLKPDNQRLIFCLCDTDCAYYFDGMSSFFEMAPNFIGLVLWCQNFGGMAGTREKTRGTGVDEGANQWIAGYTPMMTDPGVVDCSSWIEQGETKGVSDTALLKKYSTTILKTGEVQSVVTENQPNIIITEPIMNSKGENENLARLNPLIVRNTGSASMGNRDVTVQNKDGTWTQSKEIYQMQARIVLKAQNSNERSHFAMTIESVCQIVAAGAVDIPDCAGKKRARGFGARAQMGMQQRFYGKRDIPWVASVTNMLGRDVTTVSNHAAYVHSCGFFGHQGQKRVKSGTETCWEDVIVSLVHSHICFMNARAACPQNWPRLTEMARTRVVPYGMRLHATNVLLHPSSKDKTWNDVQQATLVNFMSNPVPAQVIPVFMASLLYSSMDWLLWVVIGAFARYFDVPAIDPATMERMFADPGYVLPEKAACPLKAWLQKVGFAGQGANSDFDTMVAPFDASSMEKSAVYVTTAYEDGGEFSENSLTSNIEPIKSNAFNEEAKLATSQDRMCTHVAKLLVKMYAPQLRSSCNIGDSEQGHYRAFKCIADCLIEYSKKELHYHRFGAIPAGRGFSSVNSILRACGIATPYSGGGFRDASCDCEDYKAVPFLVRQASGNVYRFGVDFRWLLFARSIFGGRPCISQSSVHAIFHHMTEQFVMHRVPHSLFPSSHIFSSMTCSENGGFAYTKLPEHARPRTFVRPTPDAIVQDNKCKVCCGLLPGLVMPEDVYLCEPAQRLANTVSDDTCTVGINDVVLPCLLPPTIPVSRYVYCEIRFTQGNERAPSAERFPAVIITEDSSTGELYVDRATDTRCDQVVRLDNDGAVCHTAVGCHKIAPVQRVLQKLSSGDMTTVGMATKEYVIHWQHHFARTGVLLELEIERGCTVYGVLKEWNSDDVDCKSRWFNPSTLGYLCVLGAAGGANAVWPETPPEQFADYPQLFQRGEMFWNVPGSMVDEHRVPIGSTLLLDASSADAAALVGENIAKIGLVEMPADVEGPRVKRGATVQEFEGAAAALGGESHAKFLPVIRVTLVYELPGAVLTVANDNQHGMGVYVGFKIDNPGLRRHGNEQIQYGIVSPRSLVSESRLSLLNLNPVYFAFCE